MIGKNVLSIAFHPRVAAYETIVTNSDIGEDSDTYESYYLAYGLFGIFIKWAMNSYTESAEDMTKIVVGLVS